MKRSALKALAISCILASASFALLAFGNPQWKRCYVFQAYYWPKHQGGVIEPPSGYHGVWRTWLRTGQISTVSSYSSGQKNVTDYFVYGRPWMRVSYKGGHGAACGYEYRFSAHGDVTYICTYLPDRPGEPIVIFDPTRSVDLRTKYSDVLRRYVSLESQPNG